MADSNNSSARKKWRVVHNVVLSFPAKVTGKVLHPATGESEMVNDAEIVPTLDENKIGDVWVMSGGIIEVALTPAQESRWLKVGAIASHDANLHLNIEDVFGDEIAQHLRANNIWTLEDVASEKRASLASSALVGDANKQISLRDFLCSFGRPDQVNEWIAVAKQIVAPPEIKTKMEVK